MPVLVQAIPNEQWQLVLEFANGEYRLFDASVARTDMGWADFAFPNVFKHLAFDVHGVNWSGGRRLDVDYLHARSRPISPEALARQTLRLGYRNQAPTPIHASHHVYYVYLFPFSPKPFGIGESIAGGHAELGGGTDYDLPGLLAWPNWREHFEQSGCAWAISMLEAYAERDVLRILIDQVCQREGMPAE